MLSSDKQHRKFELLRQKAELILTQTDTHTTYINDIDHLVHELQVHQAELETQNEALKEKETELSDLKEKYQNLFESAPVAYFLLDSHLIIQELNRKGAQYIGRDKQSIIGSALYRFVSRETRDHLHQHMSQVLSERAGKDRDQSRRDQSDKAQPSCEVQFAGRDALEGVMHVVSFTSQNYILTVMLDISDQKQKELELAQSRQDYANIVEMANSLIITTDSKGVVTFINHFALDLLGFRREEVLGKQIVGLLIPEVESSGRNMGELEREVLQHPSEHTSLEHENLCSDGSRKWVHWENRIVVDSRGRFNGILGVGQDVTKRKQAEEVLKRDKEALEKLVEERTAELLDTQREMDRSKRLTDLGRLSATMAHELRRPIAALKLSHYNIRKKSKNPSIDKHLNHCEEKCLEAEQIIKKILDSSTLKAPEKVPTDLYTLIHGCIDHIERTYAHSHLHIVRILGSLHGVQITVDPYQIKEVVYSILQNACEAMQPETGTITVEGGYTQETVQFKVIDTNGGIPDEEIEKVTEPYYTTKHRGFGLGLTLSLEIIRQHAGQLDIDSSFGSGTTVTVTLPYR